MEVLFNCMYVAEKYQIKVLFHTIFVSNYSRKFLISIIVLNIVYKGESPPSLHLFV